MGKGWFGFRERGGGDVKVFGEERGGGGIYEEGKLGGLYRLIFNNYTVQTKILNLTNF